MINSKNNVDTQQTAWYPDLEVEQEIKYVSQLLIPVIRISGCGNTFRFGPIVMKNSIKFPLCCTNSSNPSHVVPNLDQFRCCFDKFASQADVDVVGFFNANALKLADGEILIGYIAVWLPTRQV